jgi:hypothetical protein
LSSGLKILTYELIVSLCPAPCFSPNLESTHRVTIILEIFIIKKQENKDAKIFKSCGSDLKHVFEDCMIS